MSINVPLRISVKQDGAQKGYVEAFDFLGGGVTIDGPIARIQQGGGDGGDAATLDGHPASYFATAAGLAAIVAQILSGTARNTLWANLGVAVQSTPPASGVTYAQWLAGTPGTWAWIQIP